jgi:riboflavin biosynthesis pyrimidine reductase
VSDSFRLLWPQSREVTVGEVTDLYTPADRSVPLVRVNFVTSLDGAVTVGGYSKGLGSDADLAVFTRLRMVCDALMVGAGTLLHENYGPIRLDGPRREWREANGLPAYPTLVVVSQQLTLSPDHPALADAPVRPIVLTNDGSPRDRRSALASRADVLVCGDDETDFEIALAHLRQRGLVHILSEGGPHVLGALTQQDLVDELCLTFAPLLAGPGAGRITAGRSLVDSPPRGMRLANLLKAGDVLLSRYVRDH